ncbi:MAG: penicillin acylase family protein [Acidobacteria bacterium]|nr:penicillin acylase family protein [Acidobacteriota bacterium]
MRRLVRLAILVLTALLLATASGAAWLRWHVRGSLPDLDGERRLGGLSAPVDVTRDRLGIPTIRGLTRADVARATGFLHAQDRFFQMDLARRRAAGELAALVGARAVPLDRDIRIHRFRAEAERAVTLLELRDRQLLESYTAGVNAGLEALNAPPFEYLLLRQAPVSWVPEDSLLVVLSMFVTLQESRGDYEATLATMQDILPPAMVDFLNPAGSEWDAPLVGEPFVAPEIPGAEVYDLRAMRARRPRRPPPGPSASRRQRDTDAHSWAIRLGGHEGDRAAIGSNSFAVAGDLTADGGALVANDMHLNIRVPNTWYRASLEWPDASNAAGHHQITGVTLPGVPAVVVGSNTYVAWGFTNTYADWSDLVLLDTDPDQPDRYMTPEGWRAFDVYDEVIDVVGGPAEHQSVRWTIWGPVLEPDHVGRPRAYRWVAHSVERLASSLTPLESARTLEEAFDEANGLGTPGQNVVAADRSGRVGWSVYGSIPRRRGLDGRTPTSWSDGSRGWDGWLGDSEYPRIIAPPGGRVWTANARVVDGEMLALLGDGSYEIGSRARIIRERLAARDRFSAHDLLDIQLDTSAAFLARWRGLLLDTLTVDTVAGDSERALFRSIIDDGWSGQATADSAAYRLTREFRNVVSDRVIAFVLSECYDADRVFDYTTVRRRDTPIWMLVAEQPQHLLDPRYENWTALLVDAVDATIERAMRDRDGNLRTGDLHDRVWSEYNVAAYQHPLSGAVPFLDRWLDMPRVDLPGDLYSPRVQSGTQGASERMVVSPGREIEGIMQMPIGQSGHPLSPFYANSHEAWLTGEPTPFLPGPAVHTLTLTP